MFQGQHEQREHNDIHERVEQRRKHHRPWQYVEREYHPLYEVGVAHYKRGGT